MIYNIIMRIVAQRYTGYRITNICVKLVMCLHRIVWQIDCLNNGILLSPNDEICNVEYILNPMMDHL